MAALFQFRAQFHMVVDFAVEDDHGVAVRRYDRLVARVEIDDLQPRGAERYQVGLEDALLVGAAMKDRSNGAPDPLRTRNPALMCKADDSAQFPATLEALRLVRPPAPNLPVQSGTPCLYRSKPS